MNGFLISVLELRELGSFVGYFYVTRYDVGGTCGGLLAGGIMTASEIYDMKLNDF